MVQRMQRQETYQPKSVEVRSDVANPKSAMHIRSPSRAQRMFSGFRSRWKIPIEWQYSVASTTWRNTCLIRVSLPIYYKSISMAHRQVMKRRLTLCRSVIMPKRSPSSQKSMTTKM